MGGASGAAVDKAEVARALERDGYAVVPQVVPEERIEAALRLLNLSIRRYGLSAEEIAHCQEQTFFPHLRWEPEVWGLLPDPLAAELLGWREGDDWAEPQLLIRFPDEDVDWPLTPHVDEPPPWSGGRGYRGIAGVALTDSGERDGTPCVWPGSHRGPMPAKHVSVPLRAGDLFLMDPQLAHAGTLNLGGRVRSAVYFRLLAGS